jgi:dGTPase
MANPGWYDRRHTLDSDDGQRSASERDRDRVLYTLALRRLAGVTQVVSPGEGHIFHNRLTHTLEVSQIARRLAQRLAKDYKTECEELGGIDEDVAEGAALAHDLGHPPFGHVTEKELDKIVTGEGELDGFEGNAQSFRIISKLEAHGPGYRGLDLTRATLNAVLKYPWLRDLEKKESKKHKKFGAYRCEIRDFTWARAMSGPGTEQCVEAAIMDQADSVAYSVHDLDDFYRAGLVPLGLLVHSDPEWEGFLQRWVDSGGVSEKETDQRQLSLRDLIATYFVLPFYGGPLEDRPVTKQYIGRASDRALLGESLSSLIAEYVRGFTLRASDTGPLYINPKKRLELKFLQRLVWDYVIDNPKLATQQFGQRKIIQTLFRHLLSRRQDSG